MRASFLGTLAAIIAGDSGTSLTSTSLMQQIYSTTAADPNVAAITPAAPSQGAIFYQDPSVGTGTNVWTWSVALQVWRQFSA